MSVRTPTTAPPPSSSSSSGSSSVRGTKRKKDLYTLEQLMEKFAKVKESKLANLLYTIEAGKYGSTPEAREALAGDKYTENRNLALRHLYSHMLAGLITQDEIDKFVQAERTRRKIRATIKAAEKLEQDRIEALQKLDDDRADAAKARSSERLGKLASKQLKKLDAIAAKDEAIAEAERARQRLIAQLEQEYYEDPVTAAMIERDLEQPTLDKLGAASARKLADLAFADSRLRRIKVKRLQRIEALKHMPAEVKANPLNMAGQFHPTEAEILSQAYRAMVKERRSKREREARGVVDTPDEVKRYSKAMKRYADFRSLTDQVLKEREPLVRVLPPSASERQRKHEEAMIAMHAAREAAEAEAKRSHAHTQPHTPTFSSQVRPASLKALEREVEMEAESKLESSGYDGSDRYDDGDDHGYDCGCNGYDSDAYDSDYDDMLMSSKLRYHR
jgi:hypothetical protein